MNKTELAWAAGFFDGEGCASLHKRKHGRKYACLNVSNTREDNILRFYNAVNQLGFLTKPRKRQNHYKTIYCWQTTKDTAKIFELLSPYLGKEKSERIKEVLNLEDRCPDRMARRGIDNARSKLTEEQVIQIRNSLLSYSKIAKQYGVSKSAITLIKTGRNWKHLLTPGESPAPNFGVGKNE